mgnify:CR=1 FL=1
MNDTKNRLKDSRGPHLPFAEWKYKLYEDSNIYFVRSVEVEYACDGTFQLLIYHFEDSMLTAYGYVLLPRYSKRLLKKLPTVDALKKKFGYEDGDVIFQEYCRRHRYKIEKLRWYL